MSKEYEIKTKMEQEQWPQLKMLFLLGYYLKIVIGREELTFGWAGGDKNLVGAGVYWSGFF